MPVPFENIVWQLSVDLESWCLVNPATNFVFAHVCAVQAGQEVLRGYVVHIQNKNNHWHVAGHGFSLLRAQQVATLKIKKLWRIRP